MSVVVGYGPNTPGESSLGLGALLARSLREPLVVCCVVPDRWEAPGLSRSDDAYVRALRATADQTLERARDALHQAHEATFTVRTGRSVPRTLLDEAAARNASVAVVGSSSRGAWGQVALGSVTDWLLHSAELPVALAPRGYRPVGDEVLKRVTVALDGSAAGADVLVRASRLAHRVGARLRVVCFAVRGRSTVLPDSSLQGEAEAAEAWRDTVTAGLRAAVAGLETLDDTVTPEDLRVVEGHSWVDTLERGGWESGDLLVLGSGTTGAVSRVFLGSTASRIVRSSPVPVLLLPREAGP